MRIGAFAMGFVSGAASLLLLAAAPNDGCMDPAPAPTEEEWAAQARDARERIDVAASRLHEALDSAEHELHGGAVTPAGAGPRYRLARIAAAAAQAELDRAAEDLSMLRGRREQRRDDAGKDSTP